MENKNFKKIEIDSDLLVFIENSITAGVNEGVRRAIETIKNQERLRDKVTYDTRLKNTRLLVRNYRKFLKSCEQVTCTEDELDTATVSDILDKLYCSTYDEVTVVQSILISRKRTEIILEHVKRIINIYLFEAESSKNDLKIRRANIISDLYIKGKEQPSILRMSEKYHICEKQICRDRDAGIDEIAVLMFRNRWYKENILMSKTCPCNVICKKV